MSGSKRRPSPPADVHDWQADALRAVAKSSLAPRLVLGGGVALAAFHLHHRYSEDIDFFSVEEIGPAALRPVAKSLARSGVTVEEEQVGPRRSLVLLREHRAFGRIDFAFYPYDPIGRRGTWNGLRVESLIDMTVNKVQALMTRFQPRDFVDLYFLLREGPERDAERLLGLLRAKFDVGADRLALASRMLLARDIRELPRMIRPVTIDEIVAFFDAQARALVRKG